MKNTSHLRTRALTEGALFVGLAFLLGYVKLWQLPSGGSLTPAMFPPLLYALRFGLGRGLAAGFLYGLLQLLFDGAYAWGWQCMLLDYLLALSLWACAASLRARPGAFSPVQSSAAWVGLLFTTCPA